MTDDLGRPLVDFHTLDQCPCGKHQLIHEKRYAYPSDICCHVPGIMVLTWTCPDCGLVYCDFEDKDGREYDIEGNPLEP